MRMPSTLGPLLTSLTILLACDPGYGYEVEVTVSEAVADDYDAQDRGLLVIDADEGQLAVWIVCGAESAPIVAQDGGHSLGCPDTIEVRAFIAPLDPSDTRECGELAQTERVDIDAIDPAWPEASTTLRNPCENSGKQLTLALE